MATAEHPGATWTAYTSAWTQQTSLDYNSDLPTNHQLASDYFNSADTLSTGGFNIGGYVFDAVAAVGMAACSASDSSNINSLFEAFKALSFSGVSGTVQFDSTGNRLNTTGVFVVKNVEH